MDVYCELSDSQPDDDDDGTGYGVYDGSTDSWTDG